MLHDKALANEQNTSTSNSSTHKHDIIRILKINTLHNSADLFTKYISKETLHRLIQSIGIRI